VYDPLIAVGRESNGMLVGLLLLARERKTGALVHVGEKHAEYQTWIAQTRDAGFITKALDAVREVEPGASLQLRYVPAGAPLDALMESAGWGTRAVKWQEDRGVADLGASDSIVSLVETSRYRYRMRKLGALGRVDFRSITGRSELEPWLDALIAFCDVRQGAINASFPFHDDALKREFHLAMLDHPELLHVTLLTAGDTLISAQINFRDRKAILLGLISHSPMFGKLSPGTLHLLLLARLANQEAFDLIDLTPGGEYKDRFASRAEPTYVVNIQFSAGRALRAQARDLVARTAKARIRQMGLRPADVRRQWEAKVASAKKWLGRPTDAAPGVVSDGDPEYEISMYRFTSREIDALPGPTEHVRVNETADLLLPDAAGTPLILRRPLLRAALARFERGEQLLTRVRGDAITHCAWVVKGPSRVHFAGAAGDYELAESSALLYAFSRFTSDVEGDATFLRAAMAAARSDAADAALRVAVDSSDSLLHQLDAVGGTLEWRLAVHHMPVASMAQPINTPAEKGTPA
jgi:CelD/BcsL family acetyltransferase involved in cellulose biosynthesis